MSLLDGARFEAGSTRESEAGREIDRPGGAALGSAAGAVAIRLSAARPCPGWATRPGRDPRGALFALARSGAESSECCDSPRVPVGFDDDPARPEDAFEWPEGEEVEGAEGLNQSKREAGLRACDDDDALGGLFEPLMVSSRRRRSQSRVMGEERSTRAIPQLVRNFRTDLLGRCPFNEPPCESQGYEPYLSARVFRLKRLRRATKLEPSHPRHGGVHRRLYTQHATKIST